MTVFDRVKELCKKRGITVAQLEDKVGFGRNSMYSWKKNKPSSDRLEKVADYFNVSTDYLLGRTEDPEIETIAAHHEEEWTEEEMEEIERFKEFVKLKRQKNQGDN
ncbi:helix-turn-helix domain-containing protein [Salimicrobium halophilum]|uniref:Transcriptional regulator, contains XRE-family HTH domain n=1 Tax=Salimicrobium halophilum TaxID=86666 RepID=A0A1G8WFP4_9BACI|nr:helix-turn-helix transcriptional regulator [Salimicrobium halophilum]SDJ76983.1 Transcriptional regulator, contains XRE-family HTH domain [Salimicrobium halophilum]